MRILLLRLDAPLMSFGSVLVDQFNRTEAFPYRAMLVGLLANACGFYRSDFALHESLQRRLRYAARRDRSGSFLVDYQTVDFSQDYMSDELAWTAEGQLENRKGGDASDGTHIRYRHYLADAVFTVACSIADGDSPSFDDVVSAIQQPARPLFLGRKCCPPATPVFLDVVESTSLKQALTDFPRTPRSPLTEDALPAIWPAEDDDDPSAFAIPRTEDRDWSNAIHVGRTFYVHGNITPLFAEDTRR